MNIKEAKEQIKNAMTAYFTKDEFGNYVIPPEKQRPVFLMGPPGIGKTAIMEQIAQEMGVNMLSYSMTHHTRQSALGLPFISEKEYDGKKYSVSEYTMSEIIASVYDRIALTGNKEGILFLDEINCVSETLSPIMLQFLQYKVFGKHKVPEGWIVVTAGNPPEYNNSVREFDIVTWDRLKRVDVEPDYEVWKEYAYKSKVHAAILSYLDIKKGDFYKIETTVDGKSFVTARGWSDLSEMMKLYEQNNIAINEKLIVQYLQNKRIAKDFAVYYDLFIKYKSDYQVDKILEGKADERIYNRASHAKFDERLSLLSLLLDAIFYPIQENIHIRNEISELTEFLKKLKTKKDDFSTLIQKEQKKIKNDLKIGKEAGTLDSDKIHTLNRMNAILDEERELLVKKAPKNNAEGFKIFVEDQKERVKALNNKVKKTKKQMENVFEFCEDAFDEGQEMLILVTELTINPYSSRFISTYGCDAYFKHNKELLFYERQKEIIAKLDELELEE